MAIVQTAVQVTHQHENFERMVSVAEIISSTKNKPRSVVAQRKCTFQNRNNNQRGSEWIAGM